MSGNSFGSLRFAVAVLLLSSFAAAQAVSGKIAGQVGDPSGAAIPNATVTVTDLDRGINYKTATNETGNYQATHLLAGHYKIRIEAPGFAPFEMYVEVHVDASTEANATLTVGQTQSLRVGR